MILEIAGVKIRVNSQEPLITEEISTFRKQNTFIHPDTKNSNVKVEIDLTVEVVKEMPPPEIKEVLFKVKRGEEKCDWLLYKQGGSLVLEAETSEIYRAVFNQDYTKGTILLKEKEDTAGWKLSQLIYGPLQIMLMNYLAKHKLGVLVHSAGVSYKGEGLLFVAKTQTGKSTSARLWSKRKDVVVLNDDRIVVRKTKSGLRIFGTPWHGDFSDYVDTISSSALLKRLFFIYQLKENLLEPIKAREAFNRFFPNTFPVFWDKADMQFTIDFLHAVIKEIPCFSLGFVNDDRVVDYVINHERS